MLCRLVRLFAVVMLGAVSGCAVYEPPYGPFSESYDGPPAYVYGPPLFYGPVDDGWGHEGFGHGWR